jgi:transposase
MSKQRRTFTPEFKHEAAVLVLDRGYSHREACQSLGIGETALRRWVDQLRAERDGVTPHGKALTPEQQKIQALEARIQRLELEKTILKKATALLMSEDFKSGRL